MSPEVHIPGVHGHVGKVASAGGAPLASRWYLLRHHPLQREMWTSPARFVVCHSGRRSGKTELAKRSAAIWAHVAPAGSNIFICAPTWDQVMRIYFEDMVRLVSQFPVLGGGTVGSTLKRKSQSQGNAHIELANGTKILFFSGVAADRAEGLAAGLLWGVLDEYGNMPPGVWGENIRPQLAQTRGGAWLIGVPHGGGSHYQDIADRAKAQRQARQHLLAGDSAGALKTLEEHYGDQAVPDELQSELDALDWDAYCWPSRDILDPSEVAKMAEDLDASLFAQEAEGAFVAFEGRVYKPFDAETHCAPFYHRYDPRKALHFSLDFNVAPGAAIVAQDMELPGGERGTAYVGEVAIPQDATTQLICQALLDEWEGHVGPVYVRGDASGGQRKTVAAESGDTDWKIVRQMFRGRFEAVYDVPRANPAETDRVNVVNARLMSADGRVRVGVDPARCPNLRRDLERVVWKQGVRAIEKKKAPEQTHWTDALGYDLCMRFPIEAGSNMPSSVPYAVA